MRCLVLNNDYTFLGICSPEAAVSAWYVNKAHIEESYETVWHSASMEVNVPAVIRLKKYVRVLYDRITFCSFTKRNVHIRDSWTCQYCNTKPDRRKLTIDHVLPEAKGGKDCWENCTSCCSSCNLIKDDRTPQEAGLKLIRAPHKPKGFVEIIKIKVGEIHEKWRRYLGIIDDDDGKLV